MARSPEPFDLSRRAFLRGRPLVLDADGWDEVEARAARFGIVPGTFIGPDGRPAARPEPAEGAEFGVEPFLGEIMLTAFAFAPKGWALCNGQFLQISQNQALYSLLGTNFGGDSRTVFNLPDLRSRIPMHFGSGPGLSPRSLAERAGQEDVTVIPAQMVAHTHAIGASSAGTTASPVNGFVAPTSGNAFASGASAGVLATQSAGGSQSHPNLPPYLVMSFCIALSGIFPSRT